MLQICNSCKKEFNRKLNKINENKKLGLNCYCSRECLYKAMQNKIETNCTTCGKIVIRSVSAFSKTKNPFCSQSCAATYNNTHKTKGVRRSKLEKYIEEELMILYPNLEIHFNRKDTINSELDIYLPSLKLAFELNGIFHYEPIYGQDKLNQVKNNDNRKFQACLEQKIELCIIDTSSYGYFKPKTAKKFLDIIVNIIQIKSS